MKDISKRMIVISIVFCLLFSNFATLISFAVEEIPFEVDQTLNSNESENTNEEIDEELIQTDEALEIKEEGIEPELEFLRAYKTLNGVFVKAKFYESTQNILENLDNAKVQIKAPTIEGYNLINTHVESVELNDDTSEFFTTVENNDVIIDIVRKVEEDVVEEISEEETIETQETTIDEVSEESESEEIVTNESETEIPIQDEVSVETESEEVVAEEQEEVEVYDDEVLQLQSEPSENVFEVMETPGLQALFGNIGQGLSNLQNTNHEYVILYEFEGSSETAVFNVEMRETLNYTDKDPKELAVIMEKEIPLTERDSNEYNLSAENQSLYKGYLYANSITDLKYETKYTCINNIKINSLENINNIVITDTVDKLFTNGNQEIDMSKYVSYKKSSVKVEEFNNIFGEDGYIEIFKNGKSLGRIDKTSKVENDKYVFEYPEISSNVEFSFNNIKNTGTIDILNNKSISGTADFTRADVINFDRIESESIVQEFAKEQDTLIKLSEVSNKISVNLEDTESKMELSLNTNDLSTDISNDVMITVTLKTNQEKYELFKNPTIEVEFPYTVEDVNIKNINLIYKNGLSLDTYKVEAKESGEKVIKVSLAGTQEEYAPGTMLEGTQLVIYANVKLNRLVPNGSSNLKLRYTNEVGSKIAYEAIGNESETCNFNYVSRSGLLTASTFENYNNNLDSVFNFENELNVGALDVQSDEKTAKMSMTVLNNYDTEISNVEIIGRIPAIGNTDKDGNDLHTTIDTYLKREITLSGLVSKIYYSTDITATRDSDSWQENIEDITKAKSYKIVIENETMKKGETISFDYDLVIPENLDFNQKIYGVFSVYYNLNGETIVEDSIIGAETQFKELKLEDYQTQEVISDVSLGIGTQVTLAGQVIDEETEVNEGQILRYNIIVANNGTQTINNIKLNGSVVNGNIYYQNKYEVLSTTTGEKATTYDWVEDTDGKHLIEEMTIDELKPGEVRTLSYQIVTKNPESEVYGEIEVSADEIESQKISTIKNKVKDADLKMFVTTGSSEDITIENLRSNESFRIRTSVENISDRDLENITIEIELPNYVEVDKEVTKILYGLDVETIKKGNKNIACVYIDKLSAGEKYNIGFLIAIGNMDLDKKFDEMSFIARTTLNNREYISNEYKRNVEQTQTRFLAEYTTNRENGSKVYNDDEIIYKLSITNLGVIDSNIDIIDLFPYGIDIMSINLMHGDGSIDNIDISNNYLSESILIKSKENVILEITAKVNINDCRTGQEFISNIFDIENDFVEGDIKEYSFEIVYPEGYIHDDNEEYEKFEEYDEYENQFNDEENLTDGKDDNKEQEIYFEDINYSDNDNEEYKNEEPKLIEVVEEIEKDKSNNEEEYINTTEKLNTNIVDNKIENNTVSNTNKINNVINTNSKTSNNSNTTNSLISQNQKTNISSVAKKNYSITGFVWYDEDKNGLYNDETKAENIKISLYEYTTSDIKEENLKTTITTDKSGIYKFEKVEEGKYIVVFEYDNNLYSVSDYAVSIGSATNKSYVTEKSVKINGKEKAIAVSDIISLSKNISNINMGLISKNEFDMEIKTYLESATIVNKKENKTEKFDKDSNLNKIEIASKYIDGTVITAKYKVIVKNNGNISGYINQIEDKLPNGFEFDESINNGWKLGNDGIVYNSSLSNTEIKPGETKELILVLTKNMTGNDTGTYKNEAKISNLTNNLKLNDKNEENNISSVELIIAIKTGVALYISIILFIIAIGLFIIYIIDKKFLNNKIFKKTNFITILILGIILLGTTTRVYAEKGYSNTSSKNLSIMKIEDFYKKKLSVDDCFYTTKYEFDHLRTIMCIEGNNITGVYDDIDKNYAGENRTIITWADINPNFNNNSYYITKSGDLNSTGNNIHASYFAFIGYAAEEDIYNLGTYGVYPNYKNAIAYVLNKRPGHTSALKTMLDVDEFSSSESQDIYTNIIPDAQKVFEFFNSNKNKIGVNRISDSKLTEKTINGTNFVGPFKAEFPNDSTNNKNINNSNILYYKTDSSDEWVILNNQELYDSNGSKICTTTNNGEISSSYDLSNKTFYIKKSTFDNKKIISIKLENKHYEYKARIVVAAKPEERGSRYSNGGQIAATIRGSREICTTECSWNYNVEKYSVSLNKFVYKTGSVSYGERADYTEEQKLVIDDMPYAKLGDEVYFRIDLINNGNKINEITINDEFDADKLDLIGIKIQDYNYTVNNQTETRTFNFSSFNSEGKAVSGEKWKDSNGTEHTNTNPPRKWTVTNDSGFVILKYEGDIATNGKAAIYLKFRTKAYVDNYTTNKARVKLIKSGDQTKYEDTARSVDQTNVTINKLNNSKLKSEDHLRIRNYSLVLNKYVFRVNSKYYSGPNNSETSDRNTFNENQKKDNPVNSKIDDEVVFRIDLKNNGSYLNYIEILDTFNNNELELKSIKSIDYGDNKYSFVEFTKETNKDYYVAQSGKWKATLNSSKNQINIVYKNSLEYKDSTAIYLCFKVKNDGDKIENKVKVVSAKSRNVIVKTSDNQTKLFDNNSKLESQDYLNSKSYEVTLNKFLYRSGETAYSDKVGMTESEDRQYYTEIQKLNDIKYAEVGDDVLFRIDVTNVRSDIDKVVIEDVFDTKYLKLVGIKIRDYNYNNNDFIFNYSKFINDNDEVITNEVNSGIEAAGGDGRNWNAKVDGNKITLTYSGKKVTKNESIGVYIKFKTIKSITSGIGTVNTATLNDVSILKNANYTSVKKLLRNAPQPSKDYLKVKLYNITVNKYISKINNVDYSSRARDKSAKVYVDFNQEFEYKIVIKNNNGITSNNYGIIRKIELTDEFNTECIVEVGDILLNGEGWTKDRVEIQNENEVRYNITYTSSNGFKPGDTLEITLKLKYYNIIDGIETPSDVPITNLNKVEITSVFNNAKYVERQGDRQIIKGRDVELVGKYFDNRTVLNSSDKIILKGYVFGIEKKILSITDKNGLNPEGTEYAEYGDTVNYRILITNKGEDSNYGGIKGLEVYDIFNSHGHELSYISHNSYYWDEKSGRAGYDEKPQDKVIYPGDSINLDISMKSVSTSKTETEVVNGAVITKAKNEYGQDVTHAAKPIQAFIPFKTKEYHVELYKYITENDDSRKGLTNEEKFNKPVVVEKGQYVQYKIILKNSGENTNLYLPILKDTLDDGIEFDSLLTANVGNTNVINKITKTQNGQNVEFKFNGNLSPSEELVLEIKAKITKSNLYLYNLENKVEIESIKNRNEIDIVNEVDLLNIDKQFSSDYVRLNDLEIAGKVWIDSNKDGLINNGEAGLDEINVILHDVTNNKETKVTTQDNGKYTFGRVNKATNKDENTGNYTEDSEYIQYYIEFSYNGARYQSTVYNNNGKENLNLNDGTFNDNYKIDSNAAEFDSVRDAFNKELETIEYNKAINGIDPSSSSTKNLEYKLIEEDDGHKHISVLKDLDSIGISAYSFIDTTKAITDGIDYLWLHKPGMLANNFNNYLQETEYLKYINLGLAERKLDISVTKDLYEITTTVNGEQMTYDYNQNENAREKATGDTGNDNVFSVSNNKSVTADYLQQFSGKYITGGEEKPKSYEFEFYKSDYYYRYTDYIEDKVIQDYKTENSELNVELTYRIRVTNNNVENREKIYTIIRELVDNYSSDYKQLSDEQTVVKIKDSNGLLIDKTIDNVVAWYNEENGDKHYITVKNYGEYENVDYMYNASNYHRVYLTGLDGVKLNEGESLDIFIKYVLDKDNSEDRKLKTGGKDTVVELNAYSTYNESNAPAGYVDMNSNPGNLTNEDIDNTQTYENDTYKTQVNLKVSPNPDDPDDPDNPDNPDDPDPTPDPKERTITGFVWDDARSELLTSEDGMQYIGNGEYNTNDEAVKENNLIKPKINTRLGDKEEKDILVEGATVELVELVNIQAKDDFGNLLYNDDGTPKMYTYEARIKPYRKSIQTTKTDSNGKYTINSFIPGKYIIMFHYGNTTDDEMILYNGQDYKSTTYKASIETGDSMNKIIQSLENANKSDARDDEIRRLEVISYSEKMNNEKTELLQQINLDDTAKTTLVNKTKMNAETPEFLIRPEKLDNYIEHLDDDKGYAELKYISYEDKIKQYNKDFRFILNNVDFGIQYRPEVKLELKKFISEVKAITSDGKTLLDAKFNLLHDGVGITGVELDEENSIGIEMLQYLATIINPDGTIADPGLQYINIDEEIMQGLNIQITYVFSANNLGEIDRIGKNLDALRFEKNDSGYNIYYDEEYTASGTAKNELFDEYYKDNVDIGEGKTATVRTQSKKAFSDNKGYYGKYLGSLYYDGIISSNDTIAEIKVDKILDYIDNNLTYRDDDNQGKDNYWSTTTPEELREKGLVTKDAFLDINEEGLPQSVTSLMDYKSIKYDTSDKHNLIVSVDDKTSETDSTHRNELLSKFIKPEENGQIFITASVTVSSETDTDRMSYYNAAEIVEYTTLTGRITNLNATIGNTIIKNFDPSDPSGTITKSNMDEIDAFYTARVTFTPPTGITIARYYTKLWSHQIKIIITGVLAIIVVFIGYKNRNKIKVIKPKKFYK